MNNIQDFNKDTSGNSLNYLNNTSLKGKGQNLPLSEHHVEEIVKCYNDIHYFAENYYTIVHQDFGKITIKLRDYQSQTIDNFHKNRFNILKFPRQSGKSTIFAVFLLHFILFNSDKTVAILGNKQKQSMEILGRIKDAYSTLPKWLQQGVVTWNKGEIQLENGSKILASATSSDAIRGMAISLLVLDEMAFVDTNTFDPFWESIYPTISSSKSSRVILVSTPNGMNHYYEFWQKALLGQNNVEGGNHFVPLDINWWDVPGYGSDGYEFDDFNSNKMLEIYDTVESEKIISNIHGFWEFLGGQNELEENTHNRYKIIEKDGTHESFYGIQKRLKYNHKTPSYNVISTQWMEETIANQGYRKFSQEFGCDFLAGADALISARYLRLIEYKTPIRFDTIQPLYSTFMSISGVLEKSTRIFQLPVECHEYVMGIDPAKITEVSQGDSLAIQVLDITTIPIEQVCTIEIATGMYYTDVHEVAAALGNFYNEAFVFIENNDQTGLLILDKLLKIEEYENIYSAKVTDMGFRTDRKNRKANILRVKDLIERQLITLYDSKLVAQFSTFTKKNDKYVAEGGYQDDLIMSLSHALMYLADLMIFPEAIEALDLAKSSGYAEKRKALLKQQQEALLEDNPDYEPVAVGGWNDVGPEEITVKDVFG